MNEPYYPPGKFHFTVRILASGTTTTIKPTALDSSFQEVSGIEAEVDVEEVAEGGENRFVYRLPKQAKYPPLVLKRGIVTLESSLGSWVSASVGSTLARPIT